MDPIATTASVPLIRSPVYIRIPPLPETTAAISRPVKSTRPAHVRIMPFLRSEKPVRTVTTVAAARAMVTPTPGIPARTPYAIRGANPSRTPAFIAGHAPGVHGRTDDWFPAVQYFFWDPDTPVVRCNARAGSCDLLFIVLLEQNPDRAAGPEGYGFRMPA